MKSFQILIASSILLFLMLTAVIVVPTNAEISSTSQKSTNSSLKIKKISASEYKIQYNSKQMTIDVFSPTHYGISYTNETGATTSLDVVSNDTGTTLVINSAKSISVPTNQSSALVSALLSSAQPTNTTMPVNTNTAVIDPSATNGIIAPASNEQTPNLQSPNQILSDESYGSNNQYYPWDGLNFVSGQYIYYPHDDRDSSYAISPSQEWVMYGNQLIHFQVDHATSQDLIYAAPVAIFTCIGAMLGALGGVVTAAAGACLGAVLGLVIGVFDNGWLFDEYGCMWFWVNQAFANYFFDQIGQYANNVFDWTTLCWNVFWNFESQGYLRMGSWTGFNAIGFEDPTIPQYYASSLDYVSTYSAWNPYSASVSNPNGLMGHYPDNNLATLYAGNYGINGNSGDLAMIVAYMNGEATGHIYINGYSGSGYYSHLFVYVSNDGNNWWETNSPYQWISSNTASYIDCGSSSSQFRYISVVGYDDGCSVSLHLDSVQVIQ